MPLHVTCPGCGEPEHLTGTRHGSGVTVECGTCGLNWERDLEPRCESCGSRDMRPVIAAVVEKGRGTQLSVVGTRLIHLCEGCDTDVLERYLANLPNPLMPDVMPNAPGEDDRGRRS